MARHIWNIYICAAVGSLVLVTVVFLSSRPEAYYSLSEDSSNQHFPGVVSADAANSIRSPLGLWNRPGKEQHNSAVANIHAGAGAGEDGDGEFPVQIGHGDDEVEGTSHATPAKASKFHQQQALRDHNLLQTPLVAAFGNRIREQPKNKDLAEEPGVALAASDGQSAGEADTDDYEAINVHIVCTDAVHFDVALALAGSIMLPPSLQNVENLENEQIEIALSQTFHPRVNLTIIDATDAAATADSHYNNAEFDLFRTVMLKEAKLLPIQVVKATELPANAPDVLFLASCLDDAISLYSGISRALISKTAIQCVVRHPSRWENTYHTSKIAALAKPYVSTGKWSFVATSKSSLSYMNAYFPEKFGVSTPIATALFNPVLPRTTVQVTSIEPIDVAAAIGGDFVRPAPDKQSLYQHTINRYAEATPNIKVQLLDFIGGSGKMEKYVNVPHGMFAVAHNVPLHTYFERIAQARVIVPLPVPDDNTELAMLMADMVATIALSIGRPLLARQSTYANFFESRIPSDMVIIADDKEDDGIETLPGLKAFARADTDEMYTLKQQLSQDHINNARVARDSVMEANWAFMNRVIGNFLI
ncbi:hypothetical protein POJ06DRAFT_301254 [Lipomyces tetrasporus]|uniref:Uncharacterized protein n=1 Tax=Lipomyces tetrasporus TaxID=54092 RepID=A0AAD7QSC4_9ASCO|nr:uncharacterized protein POJ06DRAFT_301254 [Lipomyces tetrasporus]KAJ8100624.1 hypothetical protein POJ06DRAFT_301254 [Lipomyces tetrasporus]